MSSRVFRATTGHTKQNPQLCGLSEGEIERDDLIMYLVCRGENARPEYQIKITREEKKERTYFDRRRRKQVTKEYTEKDYGTDDGRVFRSVYNGWQTDPSTGKRKKSFAWQEKTGVDSDGEEIWMPVKCWSQIVLAQSAEELGYDVRRGQKGKFTMTTAHKGDRLVGHEHSVSDEPDNAMVEIARAALTDEEAGLVAPQKAEMK